MLLTLAELFNDHRFKRAAEDAWHLKLITPKRRRFGRVADGRRSLVASRPVLAATKPRNVPRCVSMRSVADNAPDVSWLRPQNRGTLAAAGNLLASRASPPDRRDD